MKTFAALFAGGAVGVVLLQLVLGWALPLLGLLFGFVALAVKLALFAALAYFVYSLLRGRARERAESA
jgi:hypothetical protein